MVVDEGRIRHRFDLLERHLDERQRRLAAAAEAKALGARGISLVSRATGVSRQAIRRGMEELHEPPRQRSGEGRVREPGGGRKRATEKDPSLVADLEQLVEPTTRGDPESPLRWTCKSVRQLAGHLARQGHRVSHQLVSELLHELGYSLQANRKTIEGASHPDRNAQFEYINRRARLFLGAGDPVISVDTKKKELVGNFKNGVRRMLSWRTAGLGFFLAAVASSARTDVLPPSPSHLEITFENLDQFGDYTFFLFPTKGDAGVAIVEPGKPVPFEYHYYASAISGRVRSYSPIGPKVFAVKGPPPSSRDLNSRLASAAALGFSDPALPHSEESLGHLQSSPYDLQSKERNAFRVRFHYRLKAITGSLIKLEFVRTSLWDARGNPIP
jgi:transposase